MPKKRSPFRWFWRIFWIAIIATLVYLLWLPDVRPLKKENPKSTSLMRLREKQAKEQGKKIKTVYVWRDMEDISDHLVHAVLLAEDDTFYHHRGFDVEQIKIAVRTNWERRKFAYGGSTITQQLARTLFLSPHKNLLRKAKEAIIAAWLEWELPKRRILELYLNVVEWGKGIYGAEAAAQHYFGVPASALTPDQAVALASILPSPRRWNPNSERGFMARRRTQLTARMQRAGYLPPEVSTATADVDIVFPLDLLQPIPVEPTSPEALPPLEPVPAEYSDPAAVSPTSPPDPQSQF